MGSNSLTDAVWLAQRDLEEKDLMDLFRQAYLLLVDYPEGSDQHNHALVLKKKYGGSWDERKNVGL